MARSPQKRSWLVDPGILKGSVYRTRTRTRMTADSRYFAEHCWALAAMPFSFVLVIAQSCVNLARATNWDDVRSTQTIQVIRPRLHHLATLGKPLGFVIRGAHLVALGVGELKLDEIGVIALLVQARGVSGGLKARHSGDGSRI